MPDSAKPDTQKPKEGGGDRTEAIPKDLRVKLSEQRLDIQWTDGTRSEYQLDLLRRQCPCAGCRTDRESQKNNPLTILKFNPSGVRVVSAQLVGNYAIQFTWSDGHNTGIFDFRLLKNLGPH